MHFNNVLDYGTGQSVALSGAYEVEGRPVLFLPARRYASTVFATATCLSVCLSVRHMPVLCLAARKQDREMYTV